MNRIAHEKEKEGQNIRENLEKSVKISENRNNLLEIRLSPCYDYEIYESKQRA